MADFVRWLLMHGLILWLVAQLLFDLVALMWFIMAGRILRMHQVQMIALARALNIQLPGGKYL